MSRFFYFIMMLVISSCSLNHKAEKVYVVERDREAVFVLDNEKEAEIKDLGNLNHATIKFQDGFGYVLARNGYIAKFDVKTDKIVKKVKHGKSGIGLTFAKEFVVIVNYDPKSVMILDRDLNLVKIIETDSRNVGVKSYKDLIIFSLMDKNEIWIVDLKNNFEVVKRISNVGNLPFDALINKSFYVVGFFNEASLGVVDLDQLTYQKLELTDMSNSPVLKVPHFGYWGIVDDSALVPLANSNKIIVLDLKNIKVHKEIPLVGSPVFAAVSPDKKKLVVNYSGDKEDFISIVDIELLKIEKTLNVGRRVMHFRFVEGGKKLFVSSYFDNKLTKFDTNSWQVESTRIVPSPSGVFIYKSGEE